MQYFGGGPAGAGPRGTAGLVLLYAEAFSTFPAAWRLTKDVTVIGSDSACDIVLPVNAVSRRHAEVAWEGRGWVLRDLASRNGVLVDGRRVSQVELEATHEIRVGDVILKFVEEHADEHARYRIDGSVVEATKDDETHDTELVGGLQMRTIAKDMRRIAATPLSVMLLGESGTGKEVVARELHRVSARTGRFCAINCAAIPGNLLESELFGYKRGAFSGAERDKPGLFKAADGGTLLLDEIGDMPPEAQAKLLRVLQSREVFPLGATAAEQVDVRVVCATHRDLSLLQEQGRFRKDLFARLNEYQLRLPPLRERKEDVYMLFRTFLARQSREDLAPTFPFIAGLLQYDWPYNVRELESAVKRAVALGTSPTLGPDLLPDVIRQELEDYGKAPRAGSTLAGDEVVPGGGGAPTEEVLRGLLTTHGGNVAAVGRELGKARMQVHRWMRRFGIDPNDYRPPE